MTKSCTGVFVFLLCRVKRQLALEKRNSNQAQKKLQIESVPEITHLAPPVTSATLSNPPAVEESKLFKCKDCQFSTPHGFSFMVHQKIHTTVNCLPEFFKQLLNVNGNKEK